MTYGHLIKEMFKRSGASVKDYAERLGYSTEQVSLVLNDKQPGSLKMALAALKDAGLDIQDCLVLPHSKQTEDAIGRHAGTVRRLVEVLDLDEPIAETIRAQIYGVHEHWVKKRKKRA